MIGATALFIGKILLMILIIGAMVVILLGIGYLFHTDDFNTSDDDLILKDEVEHEENVVGEKSVFYNFLVRSEKPEKNKNNTENEPF